jgi:uncharacterized protein YbjT (DUF2867 family)
VDIDERMNVLIFGATGMVGRGVLRECLLDRDVERVLVVGRSPIAQQHEKLREVVLSDLSDLSAIAPELSGYDACFFCLGVSAVGMSEERYTSVTYDLTMSVARTLARLNPTMTFIYVTGMGTDSTERGRTMWARVKGRTENDLLKLPFRAAYMFRPGGIIPLHGITSKTRLYRIGYTVLKPLYPLLKSLFPNSITTTEQVGRAMLHVAKHGYPKTIIESRDIDKIPGPNHGPAGTGRSSRS